MLMLTMPFYVYEFGDDFMYSMYQRMIVFFYEHYTHLKVLLCNLKGCSVKLNSETFCHICCSLILNSTSPLQMIKFVCNFC